MQSGHGFKGPPTQTLAFPAPCPQPSSAPSWTHSPGCHPPASHITWPSLPPQVMSLMQSNGTDSPKDINIRYRRGADGSEQSVAIPRPVALKAKEPVSTSLKVEGGTKKGYISLTEFNSKSPGAVKAAVESLDAQGAQEYVLDLRGNPGGLAQDAVQIAGLFLGSDAPVTYTVSNEVSACLCVARRAPGGTPLICGSRRSRTRPGPQAGGGGRPTTVIVSLKAVAASWQLRPGGWCLTWRLLRVGCCVPEVFLRDKFFFCWGRLFKSPLMRPIASVG